MTIAWPQEAGERARCPQSDEAPPPAPQARPAGPVRPVYFFHIPKTGGRTIERYLSSRPVPKSVLNPKKNKASYADFFLGQKNRGCQSILRDSLQRPHLVGHFAAYSLVARCAGEYLKVCFWRHPADWHLSLYNFRHHQYRDTLARQCTFRDFCHSMLRNPMTEHLLLHCGEMHRLQFYFMSDHAKFRAALQLAEKFDRFDDISKVDDFLRSVSGADNGKPPDYNRLQPSEKVLDSIDAAVRYELERRNPVDYLLHQLAMGKDRRQIILEANQTLNRSLDLRDIARLVLMRYYRVKVRRCLRPTLRRFRLAGGWRLRVVINDAVSRIRLAGARCSRLPRGT
jgi:hypothetical protein